MFIAFVMKPQAEIDWIQTFQTEADADAFGIEESSYSELDPETDDPDHWEQYDPPVVIVFETDDPDAFDNGKYNRPIAIYQRGNKYPCVDPF